MKFIGAILQDAKSIVKWCTIVIGDQSTRKIQVWRSFWEVTIVDCSHTYQVNIGQGNRGFIQLEA